MNKKPNKGIIAAAVVAGVIVCVLVGVLIGLAILRGGSSDELVTDAFCEMVKDTGEKSYYRIPKLNIEKDWAEEVNEKMYTTLYDEYEKGKVLYDGENPTVSEMGYEWAEKDGIVSITVQLKNAFTGGYEFFVFNVDTGKEREITNEELIEIFGYDKNAYFDMMKDVLTDIYNSEVPKLGDTDYIYDSYLEDATKDESLENSLSFITDEGKLNVILPVFSADDKSNVNTIVDIETGEKKDYFTFEGEYEETKPDNDLNAEEITEADGEFVERLELTDSDIADIEDMMIKGLGFHEFDYQSSTVGYVISEMLTFSLGPQFYSLYFDDYIEYDFYDNEARDTVYSAEEADPHNMFNGHYLVMSEQNVKWLVENIFHISYHADFAEETKRYDKINAYAYEGNVYRGLGYGGDRLPQPENISKIRFDDGRYEIVLKDSDAAALEWYNYYWIIIADVQIIDGRRCLTFYSFDHMNEEEFNSRVPASSQQQDVATPMDTDYQDLFEMAYHGMADFNSNTADTAYVINRYITSIFGIGDYAIYFDDAQVCSTYSGENDADPRGMFEYYSKLPAENVKWLCENVYNIEFDENYVSDNSYCEGGYVYTYAIAAGDGPMASQVKFAEKLSDGRYSIVLESGWNYENPDVIDVESEIYIIAEIKETDGIRHWSFYDVSTKKLK